MFLVHGEPPVMEKFTDTLKERGREAIAPERNKPYDLI
ncbi:MAG: MBL fold metallo-hydrolase RNA specificity domain-containing protein [Gemmatimonadota bacterium]